jgi:hypothetical protein
VLLAALASALSQSSYCLSSNERLCVRQTDGGRDVVDWNRTVLNKGEQISWGDAEAMEEITAKEAGAFSEADLP